MSFDVGSFVLGFILCAAILAAWLVSSWVRHREELEILERFDRGAEGAGR